MTVAASPALTVAEAHARLRAQSDIQFNLPLVRMPARPPTPEWVKALLRFFDALAPVGKPLFWLLLAAGVAIALWLIISTIRRRWRSSDAVANSDAEIAAWRPEERSARALLAEADAMAAAGRYGEAARLLLHRSLEDIQKRRPQLLRPALTSREIAATPQLPDLVRGAFSAMAAAVERSLFGGRGLAQVEWEAARVAYGEFALPGAWK